MGIFDSIERLINEHGSSVILKERLTLAAEQYAALEKKVSVLATENERLKFDNEECQKQREALNKMVSQYRQIPSAPINALPPAMRKKHGG